MTAETCDDALKVGVTWLLYMSIPKYGRYDLKISRLFKHSDDDF